MWSLKIVLIAAGNDRVEVKAAQGRHRVHHFSLEQVRPGGSVRAMIASVLIERVQGGSSINDLVDTIRKRISDPTLLIRLDEVVAQTVGQDWRSLKDARFDLQLASDTLSMINAHTVPAVAAPVPSEVSEVHFRVDLSRCDLSSPDGLIDDSRLFMAASTAVAQVLGS